MEISGIKYKKTFQFLYASLLFLPVFLFVPSSLTLAASPALRVLGSSTLPNPINLTTIGGSSVIDWKDWAAGAEYVSGTSQISNLSTIYNGVTPLEGSTISIYGYGVTWSNGTVTSPVSPNDDAYNIYPAVNVTQGYSFTVPADTNVRTLYLYGADRGTGTLTATISDGSSAPYTDSSFTSSGVFYTITYSAASANQTLTITWTGNNAAQWDDVSLSAAVLVFGGGPLSIVPATLPTATQYQPYTASAINAFGGTAPYTWSVTAVGATLPEGMTLNPSTGVISASSVGGLGGYTFQVKATDSSSPPLTATANFTIYVSGASTVNVNGVSTPAVAQDTNGVNVIDGCNLFPDDSIFHQRMDSLPVDTSPAAPIPSVYQSATIKPFFGSNAGPNGIPFIQVPSNQAPVNMQWLLYGTQSDPQTDPTTNPTSSTYPNVVPQYPFPSNDPIEGSANAGTNADRHVLTLESASGSGGCQLYEVWQGTFVNGATSWTASNATTGTYAWTASNGAHWDLSSDALRPLGWTSGDAAGLPIMPLTVNYDEVASGTVTHPIRFTLNNTLNYMVWPGRHAAGNGSCSNASSAISTGSVLSQSNPPVSCTFSGPMGEIYRLKASVDTSACNSYPQSSTILKAMKQYGIILADNGISGGLIGTPDSRWNNTDLACLSNFTLSDFEPVDVSSIQVSANSGATVSPTGPAVSMTAANTNPAGTVVLTATASEKNGAVTGVVFNNVVSGINVPIVGTVVSTPPTYTMTLYNQPPNATEDFTASATDANNKTSTSEETFVTVNSMPSISTQPASQSVFLGQTATFTVTAAGTAPLTYQWYLNGSAISGATNSSYVTPSTIASNNGGSYTVVVTNVAGNLTSNPAILTVDIPPSITTQPVNQSVVTGNTATFNVVATGSAPLTYQWQRCTGSGTCTNVGTNSVSYTTPSTSSANNGSVYTVTVSNPYGSANGTGAILTVGSTVGATYTLTASANNSSYGTVAQSYAGIASNSPYNAGQVVTLTATAANGYEFGSWSGAVASTSSNPTTITMNASQSVTANFIINPNVPSAPANLVATPVSDTEINLIWDRVGTGETSITVWRSTGGSGFAQLAVLPAGSNIFTDTSCYASSTYTYQLTASNASGISITSPQVSATTLASSATLLAVASLTGAAASQSIINLSWIDNNGSTGSNWNVERSSDGVSYALVGFATGSSSVGGTVSYVDYAMSPATTYYYRIRAVNGGGPYSDYSAPLSITTPGSGGLPLLPTNLSASVNSPTSTVLNWTDTNGGTASYQIEQAARGPYYGAFNQTWNTIFTTAPGATSYTLTTTPQNMYMIRIEAKNSTGLSGFTQWVDVRTPTAGTGTPKVYSIGPGQTYPDIMSFNWSILGPGDTVDIFPNKNISGTIIPYYQRMIINARGTATAPITITGIPDPATGALPIIDGTNATTPNIAINSAYTNGFLILIGGNPGGYSPGYLTLSNLEIRNAYSYENDTIPPGGSNTFTDGSGNIGIYGGGAHGASCIYIGDGDHITIKGNVIHGCGEGVFGAGQGDPRNLEEITLDSNYIYGNGNIADALTHSTYLEGLNTLYQFNRYGPNRPGSGDMGDLKDRGAGTIVRYNFLQGGGHLIDLVETQNYFNVVMLMPSYHQTYVYGNVFFNDSTGATTPVFYGGDQYVGQNMRKGILHFYDNTFINSLNGIIIFDMTTTSSTPSESLDARNNIIYTQTANSSIYLVSGGGTYFGTNWITPGYTMHKPIGQYTPYNGYSNVSANFLTNAPNNPDFVNFASSDYDLLNISPALNQAQTLSADEPAPQAEYVGGPLSGNSPVCLSAAPDLGAFQSLSTTSCAAGNAPLVNLTAQSPSAGTVVLTAAASETNGTIAQVAFNSSSCSSNLCGTVTSSPYTMTLTNVPAGSYTYTAQATDSSGNSTVSSSASVTVNSVTVPTYTLAVTATNGVVTQSVSGVASSSPYNAGTVVTLTALPAAGHQFSSWSGAATGTSNPTTVTMNADEAVTANFTSIPTYSISVTQASNGSVSALPTTVSSGGSTTVTITPNAHYTVSSLTVDATVLPVSSLTAGSNGSYTYVISNITSNQTVTAAFAAVTTYTLGVTANNGTVAQTVSGVSSSSPYNTGTVVTLTAIPAAGYQFSSWSGAVTGTSNPTTITMSTNETLTANFTLQVLTITTSVVGQGGSMSPTGAISVNYGSNKTFTIVPQKGYTAQLTVDGLAATLTGSMYTFQDVIANHTFSVSFTPKVKVITIGSGGSGGGSFGVGSDNNGIIKTSSIMPPKAAYASQTETITANAGVDGTISPSGEASVNYATDDTFSDQQENLTVDQK